MGMIAFWSTLSLNMPDFTRFGRSQREQALGQALGLPTTMTLFPLMGVLVTSATVIVYGEAIWDPVELTSKFDNAFIILLATFTLAVATLSTNIAANVVSPSYDFSNVWPLEDQLPHRRPDHGRHRHPHPAMEPAGHAGALHLHVARLLRRRDGRHRGRADRRLLARPPDQPQPAPTSTSPTGIYRYPSGWNWTAVVALVVGAFIALGGAYSGLNADGTPQGPFPQDGLIPLLKPVYDYSWIAGLLVAFVVFCRPRQDRPLEEGRSGLRRGAVHLSAQAAEPVA